MSWCNALISAPVLELRNFDFEFLVILIYKNFYKIQYDSLLLYFSSNLKMQQFFGVFCAPFVSRFNWTFSQPIFVFQPLYYNPSPPPPPPTPSKQAAGHPASLLRVFRSPSLNPSEKPAFLSDASPCAFWFDGGGCVIPSTQAHCLEGGPGRRHGEETRKSRPEQP